jgi:hypothetical protein
MTEDVEESVNIIKCARLQGSHGKIQDFAMARENQ